ncbi:MAG: hypothetical protein HY689_16345 [Chloroflexi bacterium]|nr:hypothetical protein [Chloroflexota bacterium]
MDVVLKTLAAIVRAGLRPPAAWLGLAGLLVLGAMFTLPALAAFAAAWPIPTLISLGAWLAMAATQVDPTVYRQLRYRLGGHDPYLIRVLERRDALAAELPHLTVAGVRAEVAVMIQSIDQDLLPELALRVQRYRALAKALEQLGRGHGPLVGASPGSIAALRQLAEDQRQALDGLLTRLSDMNANLIGLSHEADQGQFVQRPREWAEELGAYWQATAEVFRASDLSTR